VLGGGSLPSGVAEQCSQLGKFGEHCLSVASCAAARGGEPRREPVGAQRGRNGFESFCRNKKTLAAGPKPGKEIQRE
jgi:hypothetical protein